MEDIVAVLNLLEFILSCYDGRCLVVDDVFWGAGHFPHLGRDSTGWIRRGVGISTPGTLLAFGGGSGFKIFLSEE